VGSSKFCWALGPCLLNAMLYRALDVVEHIPSSLSSTKVMEPSGLRRSLKMCALKACLKGIKLPMLMAM